MNRQPLEQKIEELLEAVYAGLNKAQPLGRQQAVIKAKKILKPVRGSHISPTVKKVAREQAKKVIADIDKRYGGTGQPVSFVNRYR